MRSPIAVTFPVLVLCAFLTGCAPRAEALSHATPTSLPSGLNAARVNGLSCPLCAESLIATIEDLEGVESASLDFDQGVLSFTTTSTPPTQAAVAQTVNNAGFTFVSFVPLK